MRVDLLPDATYEKSALTPSPPLGPLPSGGEGETFGAKPAQLLKRHPPSGVLGRRFFSNFILHFGHVPGCFDVTSSCIGHT